MSSSQLFSPSEHKLFLGIALLVCFLYFSNLADKVIAEYNDNIKKIQTEKRDLANNQEVINFAICDFNGNPTYEVILALQFIVNPLLILLFRRQHFEEFIVSIFLSGFILFGFLSWFLWSYSDIKSIRNYSFDNTSFHDFLFYHSTLSEFILFLLFLIMFVLQISILLRFVIEKFQAKISLR